MIKYFLFLNLLFISFNANAEVPISKLNESFIEANEATLFCRTIGKGSPILVIHGGPGLSQEYLLPQMSELAKYHFVIFYDQRGCGQSTGKIDPKTISIDNFVDDIEVIRKAFKFEKITILGHSWGGFIAMNYAIRHPQHLKKLILSNSMPATSTDYTLFTNEWSQVMAPYLNEIGLMSKSEKFINGDPNTMEDYYRIIFRTYCYDPKKADQLNLSMTEKATLDGRKVFRIFNDCLFEKEFNLLEALKTLKVPTLIIHGKEDVVPFITAEHIAKTIPGSNYVLIKECGHFPYVEIPEAYFQSIEDFLSD